MTSQVTTEQKPPAEKKRRKGPQGRPIINVERCKGCEFCVEFCPTNVLKMSHDYNQKGYHYPVIADLEACTGCDLCGL